MAETRPFQFTNFARSTLAAQLSASATQLQVAENTGDRFPNPSAGQVFALILSRGTQYEIVYCTARSSDTLTIERGKEGTTAQLFASGAAAVHAPTAGVLEQIALRPAVLLSISPDTIDVDSGAQTITLTGEDFDEDAVAYFEGEARVTTFINSTTLEMELLTEDTEVEDVFDITVQNPDTAVSDAVQLTVEAGVEYVNYVAAVAGTAGWHVSVDGITWDQIVHGATGESATRVIHLGPARERWVSIGTTQIYVSDDPLAEDWTDVTPTGWGFSTSGDIDYDEINGILVATNDTGEIFRSTDDGDTWTLVQTIGGATPRSICWDPDFGLWFIFATDGTGVDLWTSADGLVFAEQSHINTTTGGTNYWTTGGKGTEVISLGTGSNTGDVQRTTNGTTMTNNGDTPRAEGLYGGFNGQYYGITGVNGANRVFQRSATASGGSWTEVTVGASATLGFNREAHADDTRGLWWYVTRNRVHMSDDDGATWTSVLSGTFINALGIRRQPAEPISFDVTVASLGGSAYGYEFGVGGSISPSHDFPNGAELITIEGLGASGFEFWITTDLLPRGYNEVVIETSGGDVTLPLRSRDDGYTDPAESYYYFPNNLWSVADVGQVRTVTFQ